MSPASGLSTSQVAKRRMVFLTRCKKPTKLTEYPLKTEEMYRKLHSPGHISSQPTFSLVPSSASKYPATGYLVSLTPPEQAKLYSEVELMICATANHFLKHQQYRGRIAPVTLAKVAQGWPSKNRPQVIEFRYDQQTQRDLVLYNVKAFRFHGPDADDPIVLNSMMHAWKHEAIPHICGAKAIPLLFFFYHHLELK